MTNLVLRGSLWPARRIASRASCSSTPASSNMTRPGLTTATQPSGEPLPEPMRVSAGFFVKGLSGYTLIQTLPPRLILRVIAIRAASIWRFVSQPASRDLMPYSPNWTDVCPRDSPARRPRCCLRNLTRFGDSISGHPRRGHGRRRHRRDRGHRRRPHGHRHRPPPRGRRPPPPPPPPPPPRRRTPPAPPRRPPPRPPAPPPRPPPPPPRPPRPRGPPPRPPPPPPWPPRPRPPPGPPPLR